MFQKKVVKKIKTHHFYVQYFFFFENRAVNELVWKNIVESDRPQMTIWRMRITLWIITKTSGTFTEYVTLIFHYNSSCTNAPQSYVVMYIACLFIKDYFFRGR